MPKPSWKALSNSPPTSKAPPPVAPSCETPCVSTADTYTYSDSSSFPFNPDFQASNLAFDGVRRNTPPPIRIDSTISFTPTVQVVPSSHDSYSSTSSTTELLHPAASVDPIPRDDASPVLSQSPVESPQHSPSQQSSKSLHVPSPTLSSGPKARLSCSCSVLDDNEEECDRPQATDWSVLVPAATLVLLALLAWMWAVATKAQRSAIVTAATYTIMVLCLVLTPLKHRSRVYTRLPAYAKATSEL